MGAVKWTIIVVFCVLGWQCEPIPQAVTKKGGQANPKEDSLPSPRALHLEKTVYQYNNRYDYDSSQYAIQQFLEQADITNSERFYAFLYRSYTHKRLFDYTETLRQLDSALYYGKKTPFVAYFETNSKAQRALAYFDTHEYKKAGELMQELKDRGYEHLDKEYTSKIIMQEAYLLFLEKNYRDAARRYQVAEEWMREVSRCDLPMIYGKQMELYGETGDTTQMMERLKKGLRSADSCGIGKYKLYLYEMAAKGFLSARNIDSFRTYRDISARLDAEYRSSDYLKKIATYEDKLEVLKKENLLAHNNARLAQSKVMIVVLISLLGILLFTFWYYQFRQQKRKIEAESRQKDIFTQQLFENIETERHRIANDLHDSIGHQLLSVRNAVSSNNALKSELDGIINEMRAISRNLHPVMFERVGLKLSVEQLVNRIEASEAIFISSEIAYGGELTVAQELQVYRIIQEALNNILKYSQADGAKVSIHSEARQVVVTIQDNGIGFNVIDTLNNTKAFGLHSMMERARHIGGKTVIQSSDSGTIITTSISKNTQ